MKWTVLFLLSFVGCAQTPKKIAAEPASIRLPGPPKAPTVTEYIIPALGGLPVKCKIEKSKPVEYVCAMYLFRCEHDATFVAEVCPMIQDSDDSEETSP